MSDCKIHYVKGNLSLPFIFAVRAKSKQDAISYTRTLFNDSDVVKIEADLHTKNGKCHYLICDEFSLKIAD